MSVNAVIKADLQVEQWFFCFKERSGYAWMNYPPGFKFRHVRSFGKVRGADAWLFVDTAWHTGLALVIPDSQADSFIAAFTEDTTMVSLDRPCTDDCGFMLRPLMCTTVVAHFAGIGGWLFTPDALFKRLLRLGGVVVRCENPSKSDDAPIISERSDPHGHNNQLIDPPIREGCSGTTERDAHPATATVHWPENPRRPRANAKHDYGLFQALWSFWH